MRLITSPILFFRDLASNRIALKGPFAVLVLYFASASFASAVMAVRINETVVTVAGIGLPVPVMAFVTVMATVASAATLFCMSTLALIVLDLLFTQSQRVSRLWGCSAYAQLPMALWGVIGAVVVVLVFEPGELRIAERDMNSQQRLTDVVAAYHADQQQGPLSVTMSTLGMYMGVLVVALQCCALRVVSGFTVRGAWAAGIVLGSVFVVIPWAAQRF